LESIEDGCKNRRAAETLTPIRKSLGIALRARPLLGPRSAAELHAADSVMQPPLLSLAHLTVLDAGPLALFEAAAAAGFDAVGLRIVPPLPSDSIIPVVGDLPLQRQIKARMRDTGVRIFDVEAVWLMPHTDVGGLLPALDLAADLGARYLLSVGHDPDWNRLRDNFAALCKAANARGLRVMLEFIPYAQCASLDAAHQLLRAAGVSAGLLVDALHLSRAAAIPADIKSYDPELFSYMHLCDASKVPPPASGLRDEARGGRLYPGEGGLPLLDFIAAFPTGTPIAIEAPCRARSQLPAKERASLAMAAVRRLLSSRP
jgi:sugar phosphate isomerase/epimerase